MVAPFFSKQVLAFILLFFLIDPTMALAKTPKKSRMLSMYLGEVKVLAIADIERVAIGNPKVMSSSILSQGQLVVMANAVGVTSLHLWLKNGGERQYQVRVEQKKNMDNYTQIKALLKDVPGVTVDKVGGQPVVQGFVAVEDQVVFNRIMDRYKDALNLVTPADSYQDISSLLSGIPNLKIRKMGRDTIIAGEVSQGDAKLIKMVAARYPTLLNMTKKQAVVAEKMVYMQVKIMEVSKTFTENIGIDWTTMGITGPSFEFGWEANRNNASIVNSGISSTFTKMRVPDLTNGAGYFGIATKVGSTINIAERSGDAVTLAQPRLSARSGGKAQFLAGGEYPMPTTSSEGQVSVEFKQYGIILKIEPIVDGDNNIMAHVETEVSEIDDSVMVSGIPGIKTRSTQTDISMRERQTLVIAGLLKEDGSNNNDGVAWLKDLPVLGPLFRSNNFKNNKTELVIFVTPTIHDVNSPENKAALNKANSIQSQFSKIVGGNGILE
jgi:pilus assembly protein CpaC